MIVKCPSCSTRFRLDARRLSGKRVTLRCVRCRHTFKVEVVDTSRKNTSLQVVVAHSDPTLCAAMAEILSESAISCRICHDGAELLFAMEEEPPQVVVVDVALSKIFAFEVIGRIRSNPRFAAVKVILISSVYNDGAYKRAPSSLYGADDYIEKHLVSRDLVSKIRSLTGALDFSEKPGGAEPSTAQPNELSVENAPKDAGRDASPPLFAQEMEKARRLAQIIVSDIALYHEERVEEGIRCGTLLQLLAPEIAEGRRLFFERVAPTIRSEEDFVGEALKDLMEQGQKEYRRQMENKVV